VVGERAGGWGGGGCGCVLVYIGKQKIKKLTLNSFLVVLFGQSLTPTGLSSKVVGGEGMGRRVVVVMGWMLCLVDTAKMKIKKKSPNFIFTPFFVLLPTTVNKSEGFVYGMCSAHFIQVRFHSFNPVILLGIQCF
jgi:hypothetical protein